MYSMDFAMWQWGFPMAILTVHVLRWICGIEVCPFPIPLPAPYTERYGHVAGQSQRSLSLRAISLPIQPRTLLVAYLLLCQINSAEARMEKDIDGDEEGQQSWWKGQQKAFQQELNNFNVEDCMGCRFIGGGAMTGAGLYVAYVGYNRARRVGRKWGYIPSALAGSAMVALGLMRLFGRNPFSSGGQSVGIDALEPFKEMVSKSQAQSELWRKLKGQKQTEETEHMQGKEQGVEQMGQQEKSKGKPELS